MKKKICAILIAVLVAVLGASTCFIIDYYKEANQQAEHEFRCHAYGRSCQWQVLYMKNVQKILGVVV